MTTTAPISAPEYYIMEDYMDSDMEGDEDESGWTSSRSDTSSEMSIGTYLKSINLSKSHRSTSSSSALPIPRWLPFQKKVLCWISYFSMIDLGDQQRRNGRFLWSFAGNCPLSKAFLAEIGYRDVKLRRYLCLKDASATAAFSVGPALVMNLDAAVCGV